MKVTLEGIQAKIKGETYLVLPDGRTTLCMLTLENGYTIKGLSACVDAAEFNLDLGRKYALEDAIRQIWPLEGYLLAQKMYEINLHQLVEKALSEWSVSATDKGLVAKKRAPRKAAPHGLKKDGTPKKRPGPAPKEKA